MARPSGCGRTKVEACRAIDVNRLNREGCLRSGWVGNWQWTRDGERVAWIVLHTEGDRLHLCCFGGARPYFICPGLANGVTCRRRVAKLYGAGRYFLCRHC
jgi:hypothetical protein